MFNLYFNFLRKAHAHTHTAEHSSHTTKRLCCVFASLFFIVSYHFISHSPDCYIAVYGYMAYECPIRVPCVARAFSVCRYEKRQTLSFATLFSRASALSLRVKSTSEISVVLSLFFRVLMPNASVRVSIVTHIIYRASHAPQHP